jgi:beta-galactosidase/beta-glucuronidase
MKKSMMFSAFLFAAFSVFAQNTTWKIVPGKITSPWADSVNPANVLQEYPRPQMKRNDWVNLNGLWQYAILPKSDNEVAAGSFQGNILVPFAIESALSGVGKTVGKDSILWYQRTINVAQNKKGKKLLLHFGAVDWRSDMYVNGKKVGSHEGGYDPFTMDITNALKK